jgi:hypothetical protein
MILARGLMFMGASQDPPRLQNKLLPLREAAIASFRLFRPELPYESSVHFLIPISLHQALSSLIKNRLFNSQGYQKLPIQ